MRRLCLTMALLLALAGAGLAEVKITGPVTVKSNGLVRLTAEGLTADAGCIWDIDREADADTEEIPGKLLFTGPDGVYKVKLRIISFKTQKIETVRCTVTIGNPTPVPPGPTPPGPNPPVPPAPPAPIVGDGMRVLIVFDPKIAMPQGQFDQVYGQAFRTLLDSKCAVGTDGKTKEWRIWPGSVDASAEVKLWQDAFARKRDKLPWIVVSNGVTGFEGPLPERIEDATALVNKYAKK